ncbi:MAG: ATP-dependent DNA helicase PcrA [Pelotomaculum sp. PtaB.Bin104]|nr:MAG: ATP-dependent DNA helicase PcrA [Pelotomaculum sp. PtaB.Bin104]
MCWKPADTKAAGGVCPVCGGRITVGVLHRVEALADREEGFVPRGAKHFESLVPLREVIAASIGYTAASVKVTKKYYDLIRNLGPELFILREAPLNDIELAAGPCIAEGIRRLRVGKVEIQPGFDGEYGRIKIMDKSEIDMFTGQLCFFNDMPKAIESIKVSAKEAEAAPVLADTYPPDGGGDTIKTVPSDMPYGLNQEQWGAVSSSSPAIAVIAGPGTGKTKTLVCRIAYLVEKCGIRPSQVTAVTFTNKAASEMRVRLEKHFGDKRTAGAMTIGTFHSICLQVLSKWKGKNNITIIDEYNAVSIIEEILKGMNLKVSPRDVMRRISLIKSGVSPVENQKKTDIPAEVYDLYCSQLERYGVMDYDDILLEALKRFESANTGDMSDRSLENSFSYLLVDEFQDINGIQYRLIKEWGRKSRSIFIIGDPDQSIYGFRGSDFRYFERFKADFPGTRQVRLTQNYRSTPEIIICAKSVISKKAAGGRACSLDAKRESGAKVRLIEAKDEFSEALFVSKEINRMVGGIDMLDTQTLSVPHRKRPAANHSRGFSDIAVLYRTNRQAEILEQCFLKEGIQYVVVGRDEFLSDKLVREAIAFFRFLLNPGDIASLLLCLKAESIYSPDLNQKVLESYVAGEKSVSSLARIMEGTHLPPHKPGKPQNFIEMLRKYEPVINRRPVPHLLL